MAATAAREGDFRRKAPLLAPAVLSVANFLLVLDGLMVTVALPAIERSFSLTEVDAQWVLTALWLPLGGMLLLGGRCGDRYGHRRMLAIGLAGYACGLLGAGLAPTSWALIAARVLGGVSAALAVPNTYALIAGMDSPADRRRAFIAPALAGSAAAASGAMLGGVLTQTIGWRLVFLTGVPVALAAVAAAPRLLPGGASQSQPVRLDAGAALLSTSGLVLLVFGITNLERAGARPLITALALTAGCGLLVAFLVRERRTPFPLLRPSLHGI